MQNLNHIETVIPVPPSETNPVFPKLSHAEAFNTASRAIANIGGKLVSLRNYSFLTSTHMRFEALIELPLVVHDTATVGTLTLHRVI